MGFAIENKEDRTLQRLYSCQEMSTENEDLFNRLAKLIQESNKNQTTELKKEIHTEVAGLKNDIVQIQKDVIEEQNKRKLLEERQVQIEKKGQHFESFIRKNNIVIFGLEYINKQDSLANFVITNLNLLLEQNLTVNCLNNTFLLGRPEGKRPILVQFVSHLTKIQVLKACKKLKGTPVSISEDLTREEREIRKVLARHKKLAQDSGNAAYIRNNVLYINGDAYTQKDLEKSEDSQTEEASSANTPTPARTEEDKNPDNENFETEQLDLNKKIEESEKIALALEEKSPKSKKRKIDGIEPRVTRQAKEGLPKQSPVPSLKTKPTSTASTSTLNNKK